MLLGCTDSSGDLAESDSTINLAVIGQALIEHDPRSYLDSPLNSIAPLLREADAVFTNLEVAVAGEDCDCEPTRNDVYFHGAGPEVVDYLKYLGIKFLSLANNHSWDYGASGILSTIAEVELRGIVHSGTGSDLATATSPAYLDLGGLRLSLVSAASVNAPENARATEARPGVNMLDPGNAADWDRNLASIEIASMESDLAIVYQHYQTDAEPGWQESWARAAISAGADIYVSHGEPTLMGVEVYQGGLIFYGLGNFIFNTRTDLGRYTPDVWQSVIANIEVDDRGVREVVFTPIELNQGTEGPLFFETRGYPEVAGSSVGESIINRIVDLSAVYGTSFELADGKAILQIQR